MLHCRRGREQQNFVCEFPNYLAEITATVSARTSCTISRLLKTNIGLFSILATCPNFGEQFTATISASFGLQECFVRFLFGSANLKGKSINAFCA